MGYLATPTTISAASTPSNVAGSAPWAVDRSCSPLRPADGVDGKMVPTAFKRIAKPPAQHQLQTQLAHQQQHPHALLGSLKSAHDGAGWGDAGQCDVSAARRSSWACALAGWKREHQQVAPELPWCHVGQDEEDVACAGLPCWWRARARGVLP